MSAEQDTHTVSQPVTPAPQPAAYADLKAALPEADAGFVCEQLDAKATLDQARAAWQKRLAEQVKARDEEIARLKAAATPFFAQLSGEQKRQLRMLAHLIGLGKVVAQL